MIVLVPNNPDVVSCLGILRPWSRGAGAAKPLAEFFMHHSQKVFLRRAFLQSRDDCPCLRIVFVSILFSGNPYRGLYLNRHSDMDLNRTGFSFMTCALASLRALRFVGTTASDNPGFWLLRSVWFRRAAKTATTMTTMRIAVSVFIQSAQSLAN